MISNLTLRQMNILNKVTDSEQPIKVKNFAKTYGVSTRTIYREIETINQSLKKFNSKVTNDTGGLILKGNNEEIMNLKLLLPCFNSALEANSKKKLILIELLQQKEPMKLQYFASKFGVSTSTISNYLKDIKDWFQNKNIDFISKPGVGIYIKTDEKSIRHAIVDLLYNNYNTDQLISIIKKYHNEPQENKNRQIDNTTFKLFNVIDYKTIYIVETALTKLEKSIDYQIEDRLYIELSIHIALAIKRLLNNEKINLDMSTLEKLEITEEYRIAEIITNYIKDEINIKIPKEEIGYIAIQLQGVQLGSINLNLNEKYLHTITKEIILNAEHIFSIHFSQDSILRKDLTMHLLYSLYRLKSGYKIRNPLIDDIKREYHDVFNKCNLALNVLRKSLDIEISDDEIGYITMHFAASIERMKDKTKKFNVLVVCSSGIGVSRMLSEKLKNIQQLNIVAHSSVLKIDEMIKKYNADLIISSVPIKRNDIKVINVNPLFTEKDMKTLEKELNIEISIQENEEQPTNIKDNFEKLDILTHYGTQINLIVNNTVLTEISANNVDTLIQSLLNEIIRNKFITVKQSIKIKELLENREKLGTIILPKKGFAIYHCTSNSIKEPLVCIGKLKSPVTLINLMDKKEDVYTAFLMMAPIKSKESLEIVGDISSSIISEPDFIKSLNKSNTLEECKILIKEVLFKKLYLKILQIVK